jgi:nucleoside-diphosphate-sugar epimerase
MKYFVSGSTGFIGMGLTMKLAGRGYPVHVLVRSAQRASRLDAPNIKVFEGDITDIDSVDRAIQGCTHAFHMAAYAKISARDPSVFYRVNVEGTRNVLASAIKHGVEKVVFTSTAGTFGAAGPENDADESGPRPSEYHTEYARTKHLAEGVCREYGEKGLQVVTVYPSRVFGPGLISESNAVTKIIKRYLKGTWRFIPGIGNNYGNYVFVEDVVRGHLLAMDKGRSGEGYILGGTNVTFNELFAAIQTVSGTSRLLIHIPYPLLWFASALIQASAKLTMRPVLISPQWIRHYLQHKRLSSAKAIKELGYSIRPLHEGIEETIKWLTQNET